MTSPIATALETVSAAIAANPEKARAKYASATATLADGLKCRVTGPSGETIETDMGKAMGWLSPRTRGRADGRKVSETVARRLAELANAAR